VLESNSSSLKNLWLAFWASLFVLPTPAGAETSGLNLCIYDKYSNIELARYPLTQDNRFKLSFIHSVSLTPVTDIYLARPFEIHQISEEFESHGAGLPSFAGDVGATGWQQRNGKFIIEMNRTFSRIQLRVQREYRNTLHIAEQDIILADYDASLIGIEVCAEEKG